LCFSSVEEASVEEASVEENPISTGFGFLAFGENLPILLFELQ